MKSDHEYESVNTTGNVVGIDMYAGDEKTHQSPMELLLSALAGCSAIDTVLMMKKKRRDIADFRIEATGERNDGIPAFYTSIHMKFTLVSPDATPEEFEKVVRLAVEKYCSVASSLKPEITFSTVLLREV
ncbi:MAG TPA: OsmC family protein [Lunatimonas sp.]|nr:OsmC family protein [Lunatimonas sp.]